MANIPTHKVLFAVSLCVLMFLMWFIKSFVFSCVFLKTYSKPLPQISEKTGTFSNQINLSLRLKEKLKSQALLKKTALFIFLLFVVIAAWSGWTMWQRWNADLLWGHLPLVFFAASWGAIVLGTYKKTLKAESRKMWWATLSGLLLALGFPVSPLTPLMFIGFVPLLMIEKEISASFPGPEKKVLFRYVHHAFMVWNILTTFWVGNTAFIAGVVAIALNSLLMTLPFLLFHQTKSKLGNSWMSYGSLIAYWISFEFLHQGWDLSWPWLTLGNSFAQYPSWVQWYEWTGTFGGSLWILLVNILIFNILKNKNAILPSWDKAITRQALRPLLLVLLPIAISLVRYYTYEEKSLSEAEVVVVQPNFEPHYEKFEVPEPLQLQRFLDLSASALTPATDYLVYPETSFDGINTREIKTDRVVEQLKGFVSNYSKLHLITGVSAYYIYEPGEDHSAPWVRERFRGLDTLYYEGYNGAIDVSNETDSVPFYKKSKLVPGAEILPFRQVFFFLKPLVDKLGGSMEGFGKQKTRGVFGPIAPVICYESIYGGYMSGYIRNGAQAIFIVTNDGWWDRTPGHRQHLAFARLRAVEFRRDIARSANTGISCFINQRGDITQPLPYGEEGTINGRIHFNDTMTLYARFGDYLGWLAVLSCLAFFLKGLLKKG